MKIKNFKLKIETLSRVIQDFLVFGSITFIILSTSYFFYGHSVMLIEHHKSTIPIALFGLNFALSHELLVSCFMPFQYRIEIAPFARLFKKRREKLTGSGELFYENFGYFQINCFYYVCSLNAIVAGYFYRVQEVSMILGIILFYVSTSRLLKFYREEILNSSVKKEHLTLYIKQKGTCDCMKIKKVCCAQKRKQNFLNIQKNICYRRKASLMHRYPDDSLSLKMRVQEAERNKHTLF